MINILKKLKTLNILQGTKLNPQCQRIIAKHQSIIDEINILIIDNISILEKLQLLSMNLTTRKLCKHCNNPFQFNKYKDTQYCSVACASKSIETQTKIINTSIEKYGTKRPQQNNDVKLKTTQTNLSKYGAHPSTLKETKLKYNNTCQNKFGYNWALQSPEIRTKIKTSNLIKYGIDFYNNLEKQQTTTMEKYRVKCIFQYPKFQKNAKEKKFIKYNDQHYSNPIKRKNTNLIKYGVEHNSQQHIIPLNLIKLNSFEFLNKQINQNISPYEISKILGVSYSCIIKRLKKFNIKLPVTVYYSKIAIFWLNSIANKNTIFIQHAENIGEYRVPGTRYSVDGYCKELNTIYEFYGDVYHGNPNKFNSNDTPHPFKPDLTSEELYNKTMKRETELKSLGYKIITIWESEFKSLSHSSSSF